MKQGKNQWLSILLAAVLLLTGGAGVRAVLPEQAEAPAQTAQVQQASDQTPDIILPVKEETAAAQEAQPETQAAREETLLDEGGTYTSKKDVALYLKQYGHLPDNFISKKEAKKQGWDGSGRTLWDIAPGKSIGGDYFGNYEEQLPTAKGRSYHECDIDYNGKSRGVKRIVFSNDGLIYYTDDHYETFTLLYGEE